MFKINFKRQSFLLKSELRQFVCSGEIVKFSNLHFLNLLMHSRAVESHPSQPVETMGEGSTGREEVHLWSQGVALYKIFTTCRSIFTERLIFNKFSIDLFMEKLFSHFPNTDYGHTSLSLCAPWFEGEVSFVWTSQTVQLERPFSRGNRRMGVFPAIDHWPAKG